MRLDDLNYELPQELIAQEPAPRRDGSRLLVLHRASGRIEHRAFGDIGHYLRPGDCLVLNNTRVLPARFGCRRATGGHVEALFLGEKEGRWELLLKPASRLRSGQRLACENSNIELVLLERGQQGGWSARPEPAVAAADLLPRIGQAPLPPYIRRPVDTPRERREQDSERYQTVYARCPGAVAAPTAGLHFTEDLLERLAAGGVQRAEVTLHVGLGTFSPIRVEDLGDHRMHSEWFEVGEDAAGRLRKTREAGGRVVAVGTTATRVLESMAGSADGVLSPGSGWTDIFIYPPYRFRAVDALITNFHLPGSTLLALVMAFASVEQIRRSYSAAISERYRFYSFGDAMLIL